MKQAFHITSVEGLAEVSDYLISIRDRGDVVAFYGPMGAGKTTLAEAMLRFCGDDAMTEQMGRNARTVAENDFDVHAVNRVLLGEVQKLY